MSTVECFYCESLSKLEFFKASPAKISACKIPASEILSSDEIKHLKVKRYNTDQQIELIDGRGVFCNAYITTTNPLTFEISELQFEAAETHNEITLILALLKGKSFDDSIKMAVELGVSRIIPWQASRSIAKWHNEKKEHASLQKTVLEAVKQCRRKWLPEVLPLVNSKNIISINQTLGILPQDLTVFYENAQNINDDCNNWVHDLDIKNSELVFVIGPEGGITDEEIVTFQKMGVPRSNFASLGKTILRAPTAVATVLAQAKCVQAKCS